MTLLFKNLLCNYGKAPMRCNDDSSLMTPVQLACCLCMLYTQWINAILYLGSFWADFPAGQQRSVFSLYPLHMQRLFCSSLYVRQVLLQSRYVEKDAAVSFNLMVHVSSWVDHLFGLPGSTV